VLRRIVQYVRLTQTLKKKAVSAAVYPAVLFTMMFALLAILVIKVIPEFESFYEGLGVQLPLPTRALMALSLFLRGNLHWIVLGIIAVVFGIRMWFAP
jgi:type IV pilus assembly protein PilC